MTTTIHLQPLLAICRLGWPSADVPDPAWEALPHHRQRHPIRSVVQGHCGGHRNRHYSHSVSGTKHECARRTPTSGERQRSRSKQVRCQGCCRQERSARWATEVLPPTTARRRSMFEFSDTTASRIDQRQAFVDAHRKQCPTVYGKSVKGAVYSKAAEGARRICEDHSLALAGWYVK